MERKNAIAIGVLALVVIAGGALLVGGGSLKGDFGRGGSRDFESVDENNFDSMNGVDPNSYAAQNSRSASPYDTLERAILMRPVAMEPEMISSKRSGDEFTGSRTETKIGGKNTDADGFATGVSGPVTRGEFINALVVALAPKASVYSIKNNCNLFGTDIPTGYAYMTAACYAKAQKMLFSDVFGSKSIYNLDAPLSRKDATSLIFTTFIQYDNVIDTVTNATKNFKLPNGSYIWDIFFAAGGYPSIYADIPWPIKPKYKNNKGQDTWEEKDPKDYTEEEKLQATPSWLLIRIQMLTIAGVIDKANYGSEKPASMFYPDSPLARADAKVWLQRAKKNIPKSLWIAENK